MTRSSEEVQYKLARVISFQSINLDLSNRCAKQQRRKVKEASGFSFFSHTNVHRDGVSSLMVVLITAMSWHSATEWDLNVRVTRGKNRTDNSRVSKGLMTDLTHRI